MTEEQALAWLEERYNGTELHRLRVIVNAVVSEAARQNLVASTTLDRVWARHVVDSAQLLTYSNRSGIWLDIGTGAGFPGLVLASLSDRRFILCEPRRLRAEFLRNLTEMLSLGNRVVIESRNVEVLTIPAETITARAVAPVSRLISMASRCATNNTEWILPRGASGYEELTSLPKRLRTAFHVEHSVSSEAGVILVRRG